MNTAEKSRFPWRVALQFIQRPARSPAPYPAGLIAQHGALDAGIPLDAGPFVPVKQSNNCPDLVGSTIERNTL